MLIEIKGNVISVTLEEIRAFASCTSHETCHFLYLTNSTHIENNIVAAQLITKTC